jgi:hypothetical protein
VRAALLGQCRAAGRRARGPARHPDHNSLVFYAKSQGYRDCITLIRPHLFPGLLPLRPSNMRPYLTQQRPTVPQNWATASRPAYSCSTLSSSGSPSLSCTPSASALARW